MVILAKTKLSDAFNKHPEIRDFLMDLSPKYKKLDNSFIFNTVKKWVKFCDIAKMGGFSTCEILHKVNKFLGTEKELFKNAPECIKEQDETIQEEYNNLQAEPEWFKTAKQIISLDVRDREDFFLDSILNELKNLKVNQILKVTNLFYPAPLIKMLEDKGHDLFYEKLSSTEHILYINYKEQDIEEKNKNEKETSENTEKGKPNWFSKKDKFETMDVRGSKEDPFSDIMKKINDLEEDDGIKLIQIFVPAPLLNVVEPMGFETYIEKINPFEHHIYFYKIPRETGKSENINKTTKKLSGKIPLVIQSATPVVYPIVMRMLQSRRLMDKIKIEELKVWDKTEKHLGWIVNGKADISFSAVAAIINLYQKGFDIKLKSVNIWDNFFMMTRNYKARTFADLKGHNIEMPLIPTAPPTAITNYLIEKLGNNLEDFKFSYGDPFGRPMEIKDKLVKGEIDTGLLREPEASYAIFESKGEVQESIKYKDIWNEVFPSQTTLPNAGIVFNGKLLREHPEIADIFMEETELATKWVLKNKKEAANMAYDIMRISPEEAEFFLSRVGYSHKPIETIMNEMKNYVAMLQKVGYSKKSFDELQELFI